MKILVIAVCAMFVVACTPPEFAECRGAGGIPISGWNGGLKDCVFPPRSDKADCPCETEKK